MEARYRRRSLMARRLQRPSPELIEYEELQDQDDYDDTHSASDEYGEKENSAPSTTDSSVVSPPASVRTQYRVTLGGSQRSSFKQYPEAYAHGHERERERERDSSPQHTTRSISTGRIPTRKNTEMQGISSASNNTMPLPLAESPSHRNHNQNLPFASMPGQRRNDNDTSIEFKSEFNTEFTSAFYDKGAPGSPHEHNGRASTTHESSQQDDIGSHIGSGRDPPRLTQKLESPIKGPSPTKPKASHLQIRPTNLNTANSDLNTTSNQADQLPFDERENRRRVERERILRLMNGLDALLVETPTNTAITNNSNCKRPPIPGTPEHQPQLQQQNPLIDQWATRKEQERAKIKSLMHGLDLLLLDTPPSSGKVPPHSPQWQQVRLPPRSPAKSATPQQPDVDNNTQNGHNQSGDHDYEKPAATGINKTSTTETISHHQINDENRAHNLKPDDHVDDDDDDATERQPDMIENRKLCGADDNAGDARNQEEKELRRSPTDELREDEETVCTETSPSKAAETSNTHIPAPLKPQNRVEELKSFLRTTTKHEPHQNQPCSSINWNDQETKATSTTSSESQRTSIGRSTQSQSGWQERRNCMNEQRHITSSSPTSVTKKSQSSAAEGAEPKSSPSSETSSFPTIQDRIKAFTQATTPNTREKISHSRANSVASDANESRFSTGNSNQTQESLVVGTPPKMSKAQVNEGRRSISSLSVNDDTQNSRLKNPSYQHNDLRGHDSQNENSHSSAPDSSTASSGPNGLQMLVDTSIFVRPNTCSPSASAFPNAKPDFEGEHRVEKSMMGVHSQSQSNGMMNDANFQNIGMITNGYRIHPSEIRNGDPTHQQQQVSSTTFANMYHHQQAYNDNPQAIDGTSGQRSMQNHSPFEVAMAQTMHQNYLAQPSAGTTAQRLNQIHSPFEDVQQHNMHQHQVYHDHMSSTAGGSMPRVFQNYSPYGGTSLTPVGSAPHSQAIHQYQMYYDYSRAGLPVQQATQYHPPFEQMQAHQVDSALQLHQMYQQQPSDCNMMRPASAQNDTTNDNHNHQYSSETPQQHRVYQEKLNYDASSQQALHNCTTLAGVGHTQLKQVESVPNGVLHQLHRSVQNSSPSEIMSLRHVGSAPHYAYSQTLQNSHEQQLAENSNHSNNGEAKNCPDFATEEVEAVQKLHSIQPTSAKRIPIHSQHSEPAGYPMLSPMLPPPRHCRGRQAPDVPSTGRQPTSTGSQKTLPKASQTPPRSVRHPVLPIPSSSTLEVKTIHTKPSAIPPVARKVLARSVESQEAQFHHGTNEIVDKSLASTPLAKTKHSRYHRGGKFQEQTGPDAETASRPGAVESASVTNRTPKGTPTKRTSRGTPNRKRGGGHGDNNTPTANDDDATVATTTITMGSEYLGSQTYSSCASSDEEDEEEAANMGKAFAQNVMGVFENIKLPNFTNCVTSTKGVLETMTLKSERVACIKAPQVVSDVKSEERREKRRTPRKGRRRKSASAVDTSSVQSSRRTKERHGDAEPSAGPKKEPNGLHMF